MRRDEVNKMFIDSSKKRKVIAMYVCVIVLLSLIFIYFAGIFFSKTKNEYVKYVEDSNIDYKVYLKENDFFEKNYADSEKQYIASLIDYIDANFKYSIDTGNKNIDFSYSYYVDAVVDVKEKTTNKSLYSYTDVLSKTKVAYSDKDSRIDIDKNIKIDYNKYNDLIKKFVSIYSLGDTESTLTVNLHVKTIGSCQEFSEEKNNDSVVSLIIPLTTKTIAIDLSNDLAESSDSILLCNKKYNDFIFLISPIIFLLLDIFAINLLCVYISNHRSSYDKYKIELKKIVTNYHSYIQKINTRFDFKKYRVVEVDSFNDMLEIRDSLQQPILMLENQEQTGTEFIIPTNTDLLYVFEISEK